METGAIALVKTQDRLGFEVIHADTKVLKQVNVLWFYLQIALLISAAITLVITTIALLNHFGRWLYAKYKFNIAQLWDVVAQRLKIVIGS